jgi:hypothetical protein
LFLSAIRPAQDAAKTKVVYAINPSVADNIQFEDLDQLRERRPTMRLFIIGLAMMSVVLIAAGLVFAIAFDYPPVLAALVLGILLFMVVGVVFVFFIFTRPLEKLILYITGLVSSRLTYFARRNVGRSTERNTLITLMVLFSGVLPSFLATFVADSNANIETDVRLNIGAPVEINSFARWDNSEFAALSRLRPSFVSQEQVSDSVGMREGTLSLVGITADLNDVLYDDLMIFTAGGPGSLTQILTDPYAVVISQGMAEGLAVPLGGTIKVKGEGLDHEEELTVVGIARRLPGFSNVGSIPNFALGGGTVFISIEGFHRLTTNPKEALPDADDPLLDRVLATVSAEANPSAVDLALHKTFNRKYDIWSTLAEVQLKEARDSRVAQQALLLTLTLISFITAVLGVFAVIYVTIYARRMEIGMLKAVGTRNWELNGILSVESIAMTLSAALAGILAGATMGYLLAFALNVAEQRPHQYAIDTTVMPFIVIMVVLASILATVFSARRIIKRKAVEILRMS